MVKLIVDGREIETEEGVNLLDVCIDNEIYIPSLCRIKGAKKTPASCRLCFVEIDGREDPVPSCTLTVQEGMRVSTDTQQVRALQKAAFELLISAHDVDCAHCPANKKCELQRIAKFLKTGLKTKRLEKQLKEETDKVDHPFLELYPNRCVLCGKCIQVCESTRKKSLLTFAGRGFDTIVSFYGLEDFSNENCEECRACVDICPVAAILVKR
jgi:bidirectional [NiFe] hydrogenase diaphorase subunit